MSELTGRCKIHSLLAYGMAAYVLASVYYCVRSRAAGTPFGDSLTAEQVAIKLRSAEIRKWIFMEGLFLAAVYLVLTRPFVSCV